MSEGPQLPDFLEFVFLMTAIFAYKFCQLSTRRFYTLFLPHTFTLYNRFSVHFYVSFTLFIVLLYFIIS